MPSKHLVISGKVQGVFYRGWAIETARSLGLSGWVRNRMDGTVDACVMGDRDRIDDFIARAHHGPSAARVTRVDVSDADDEAGLIGFEQRPTL
jgi:acylphosphatase